jgi:DNA-binding beta-propeller fold protein YncE
MKNKLTGTKFKAAIGISHLFSRLAEFGAMILICADASAQNLFMSDGYSGIDHDLGNIYKFTSDGGRSLFASELNGPSALAFDSGGDLFVAIGGDRILKFTSARAQSIFASGLNGPSALAFDSGGDLFVAIGGDQILKFTPDGGRTTFASGLNGPSGLAFDAAGNLFVADLNSGNIYKFTPDGGRSTFDSGLNYPFDLAFDTAGNLFVTEAGSGSGGHVYEYTWDGVRTTFAVLGAPEGLAFDNAGNLFVVDGDTEEIFKFTPGGVRSTFAQNVGLGLDLVAHLAFQRTQAFTPPPPPTVATPSVLPNGGRFRRRVIVRLTNVTPGTTIYYTLDGSDPTTTSIPYHGAFVLRRSATLKAMAVDSSLNQSAIAIARFRIKSF